MKRQFLVLIAVAVFAAALTTNAFGQMRNTVKVNIKFDFHIGESFYPAGEYRIESIDSMSGTILQIRSVGDTKKNQIIVAYHSNECERQTPKLVFQKYGENYLLTKITLGTEWSYSIRPSRRQREREQSEPLASFKTIQVRLAK